MSLQKVNYLKKALVCLGMLVTLQLIVFNVPQQAIGKEVYKLGVTFPFSGSLAGWGQTMVPAIQIAVDEQNTKGGINGRDVELVMEDTKGTAEGGVSALRKVIDFDKVPMVFTIFTHVLLAQIPYADSKKVVLISTTQSPGMAELSPWNFVYSVQEADELTMLTDLANRLGFKRLFSYEPDNALGKKIVDVIKKQWIDRGRGDYENAYYKYGETDFRGQVVQAQGFRPDVILLHGQGTREEGLVMKQTREAGIKVQFLVTSTDIMPVVKKACGDALEGAILTDTLQSGEPYNRLAAEFKKRTGEDMWVHIPIQYDIGRMILQAVENGGYSAEGIRAYLVKLKNFPAVGGGTVGFDANKLAKPPLSLFQIKNGKSVPYSIK